jgi:hypothetical protein
MGRRDQQNGRLTFADRHNIPFDWDEEYEFTPLIADNAPEPTPTPFPDIPAEFPGVEYESNLPVVTPDPEPSAEDRAAAEAAIILENAHFGQHKTRLLQRQAQIAGVLAGLANPMPAPVFHINIVPDN